MSGSENKINEVDLESPIFDDGNSRGLMQVETTGEGDPEAEAGVSKPIDSAAGTGANMMELTNVSGETIFVNLDDPIQLENVVTADGCPIATMRAVATRVGKESDATAIQKMNVAKLTTFIMRSVLQGGSATRVSTQDAGRAASSEAESPGQQEPEERVALPAETPVEGMRVASKTGTDFAAANTGKVLAVLEANVQSDGLAKLATEITQCPVAVGVQLLRVALVASGVPADQIPQLLQEALGAQPFSPGSSSEREHTPPHSPSRTPAAVDAAAPPSPSGPEELAVAQLASEEESAAAQAHLQTEQATLAAAQEAYLTTRDLVDPVPMKLQKQVGQEFIGKTPEERERLLVLTAAQLGCTTLRGTHFEAVQGQVQREWFGGLSSFTPPTATESLHLDAATSVDDLTTGPLSTNPAVRRALNVVAAVDAQLVEVVLAAALADPKSAALAADIKRLRKKTPGPLAQQVYDLVGTGPEELTKEHGRSTFDTLRATKAVWNGPKATVSSVVADALRVTARAFAICDKAGFVTNSTQWKEITRILFEGSVEKDCSLGSVAKDCPLYMKHGEILHAAANTWHEMGDLDDVKTAKLTARAKEMYTQVPDAKLTADSPGVTTVHPTVGNTAEVTTLRARVKTLEAQQGPSKAAVRAAAAAAAVASGAAAEAPIPWRAPEWCNFCNVGGHKVSDCTAVVFVAGTDGAELQKWSKCWSCHQYGHVKHRCPDPQSPRLNGPAPPSVGGGLAR